MRASPNAAPYWALLKPAKMLRLFGSVAVASVVALPLSQSDLRVALIAALGGTIAAAGANALNMYGDRDLDASDARTALRPLPLGLIRPWQALALAFCLVFTGASILWVGNGRETAGLVLAIVGTYALAYAWLKRVTPYYTLLGGVIWAAPIPVIWLALGRPAGAAPIGAFVIATLWTALHVWSSGLSFGAGTTSAGPCFLPSVRRPHITRINLIALSCALAAITIWLGEFAMLPFDAALIAAACLSLALGTARADRAVSIAAMLFIAAYVGVTGAGNLFI